MAVPDAVHAEAAQVSVHVSAYVWEHSEHKGTALLLLLAIADIAHKNGVAFPSVATLAKFIRMSERNTQRVLTALEKSDELEVKRNAGPNGTHLFRVKMNLTASLFEGGDKLSPDKLSGDKSDQKGVTKHPSRGDTAMSPEPKEPKEEPEKNGAQALPDWLPPEWLEFEKHRSEKRSKLTPTARQGCIRKLAKWREQGHDIVAILRNSIDNGYTGLFEPKAQRVVGKQSQLERRNADVAKSFLEKDTVDAGR